MVVSFLISLVLSFLTAIVFAVPIAYIWWFFHKRKIKKRYERGLKEDGKINKTDAEGNSNSESTTPSGIIKGEQDIQTIHSKKFRRNKSKPREDWASFG